jgi:hypothetical protein
LNAVLTDLIGSPFHSTACCRMMPLACHRLRCARDEGDRHRRLPFLGFALAFCQPIKMRWSRSTNERPYLSTAVLAIACRTSAQSEGTGFDRRLLQRDRRRWRHRCRRRRRSVAERQWRHLAAQRPKSRRRVVGCGGRSNDT